MQLVWNSHPYTYLVTWELGRWCWLVMKVWRRVLETLFGLNDLLRSSQTFRIVLFTHTTHADSIRMSVVACRVDLFTYTAHAESIRMSVVACRVKILLIVHAWHTVALICNQKKSFEMHTLCILIYRERERQSESISVGLTQACPKKILSTKSNWKWQQ